MAYSVSALNAADSHMNRADKSAFSTWRRLLPLFGLVLCLAGALSACGQRGPLYLPDK
jgi:hypothetical protein